MGDMRDILTGVAALLAAGGQILYNSTGAYSPTATQPVITFKDIPANPDRVVTLTTVPLTDDPAMPRGTVLLQVRVRGARDTPLDVEDICDTMVKPVLQGLTNTTLGSVHVVQCYRQSSVPFGVDDSLRWERADHYYLDVDYPATTNQPEGGWD